MANMLSAQLATMKLNVIQPIKNASVDGNALIFAGNRRLNGLLGSRLERDGLHSPSKRNLWGRAPPHTAPSNYCLASRVR
jgi:hypothetical protein